MERKDYERILSAIREAARHAGDDNAHIVEIVWMPGRKIPDVHTARFTAHESEGMGLAFDDEDEEEGGFGLGA